MVTPNFQVLIPNFKCIHFHSHKPQQTPKFKEFNLQTLMGSRNEYNFLTWESGNCWSLGFENVRCCYNLHLCCCHNNEHSKLLGPSLNLNIITFNGCMILIQSASFLLLTKWTFVTWRKQKKKGAISSNNNTFTSSSNAHNVKASCKFALVQ